MGPKGQGEGAQEWLDVQKVPSMAPLMGKHTSPLLPQARGTAELDPAVFASVLLFECQLFPIAS